MTENPATSATKAAQPEAAQLDASSAGKMLEVAPSPHVFHGALTTRRMMLDVLLALVPVLISAFLVFRWFTILQVTLSVAGCFAAEALFTKMRGRKLTLSDGSALVTGAILGLSLPATAPWYVSIVGAFVAIGIGKAVFGGLGNNIFNPAMVGRAFVMIAFPAAMGASAYVLPSSSVDALTRATPLTALKMLGQPTGLGPLFLGTTNGSLGETSALASLLGGLYLCWRRTASWEIPAGSLLAVFVLAMVKFGGAAPTGWSIAHELCSGALLFGAFYIATDPVSSPLTPTGKWIFGAGFGALVMLIRKFSGYPEGVMFSVLIMNAWVPLINRWTIPTPVGGPASVKKSS